MLWQVIFVVVMGRCVWLKLLSTIFLLFHSYYENLFQILRENLSEWFGRFALLSAYVAVRPSVRCINLQSLSPKFHIVYAVLFLYGEQRISSLLDCNFLLLQRLLRGTACSP